MTAQSIFTGCGSLPRLAKLAFQDSADNCPAVQLNSLSHPPVSRIIGKVKIHLYALRVYQALGPSDRTHDDFPWLH